ncbi:MAG: hypothetical protein QXY49_01705 [Thermofilaceae archaeon]
MTFKREEKVESENKDFFREYESTKARMTSSNAHKGQTTTPDAIEIPMQRADKYTSLDSLVASLKILNFDTKPLEALRDYAKRLEEEESRLLKEIQDKQRILEKVRSARDILRKLGL